MNTTQLLNILLAFVVIWISVGTLYFLFIISIKVSEKYHRFIRTKKEKQTPPNNKKVEEKVTEEYQLIGKTKPRITQEIPEIPSTSPEEKAVENIDRFASETPNLLGDSEEIPVETSEEENELQVDYSDDLEEVDWEQNEREALLIFEESTEPPHTGGVLVKELVRLQNASQKEELDEEEEVAVRETIRELHGTDYMEQYNKNLAQFTEKGKAIAKVIREENEKQPIVETQVLQENENLEEEEEKPLSYYL